MNKNINLEDFVGHSVIVTLSGDNVTRKGVVEKVEENKIPNTEYIIRTVNSAISHYNKFGESFLSDGRRNDISKKYDINTVKKSCECKDDNDVQAKLKENTVGAIAHTLMPEALQYVQSDNKFADVVVSLLESFLQQSLGNIDQNVKGDIICHMLDEMVLEPRKRVRLNSSCASR